MDTSSGGILSGIIVLWYGLIADIPSGWVLCDGANGTPNLENVFVVGAGDTYVVNATGGSLSHVHGLTGMLHTHTLPAGSDLASGANFGLETGGPTESEYSDQANVLPPYRALAYIMKW